MNGNLIIRAMLLGVGLAMDACAVSMANGFNESKMSVRKTAMVAGFFGVFQGVMPMIGYFVGYSVLSVVEKIMPWISLIILCFLGGKMIKDGFSDKEEGKETTLLTLGTLTWQAFATSVDALSVGFTLADYVLSSAVITVGIIAVETFIISFIGVVIGKKFGTKFGGRAEVVGGVILIAIGLEIFITHLI